MSQAIIKKVTYIAALTISKNILAIVYSVKQIKEAIHPIIPQGSGSGVGTGAVELSTVKESSTMIEEILKCMMKT